METTLQFRSFDGSSLEGTYTSGATGNNDIAILIHGITSSRDEFGLFSGLSVHLAEKGIPSFRFDYRCHGASKLPMETMTLAGDRERHRGSIGCGAGTCARIICSCNRHELWRRAVGLLGDKNAGSCQVGGHAGAGDRLPRGCLGAARGNRGRHVTRRKWSSGSNGRGSWRRMGFRMALPC